MEDRVKVLIASDHAGFHLKEALRQQLAVLGYEVEDLGAFVEDPGDDYPEHITSLAERISENPALRGIAIGGSGQGEAMCANRIKGVRAAVFYGKMSVLTVLEIDGGHSQDGYDCVRLARRHNDANILAIGARFVRIPEADEAVRIFLETPFSNDTRHVRRLAQF